MEQAIGRMHRIIVKGSRATSERLECWAQGLELDAVGDLRATEGFYPTSNTGSDASGEGCLGDSVKDGLAEDPGLMERLLP